MTPLLIGIFLIAHGLAHGPLTVPNPDDPESGAGTFFTAPGRSRLLRSLGLSARGVAAVGGILLVLTVLGFIVAGAGIILAPQLYPTWSSLAVGAALTSLVLLITFWHPWLVIGVFLDAAILYAFLWADLPLVGATGG